MSSEPCVQDGIYCCKFPDKCPMCINQSLYVASKVKKKTTGFRQYKKSDRMGASFEEKVRENTNTRLYAASNLTPNSGAGDVKGDIAISGCIDMALELKTKIKPKITRGSLSFTIQKEWLEKLNKESKAANKEFWALVFSFTETDNNIYSILEYDQLLSMICTMTHDRIKYNTVKTELEELKKRYSLLETQIVSKNKEIELLKSSLENNKTNNNLMVKLNILTENTLQNQ